MEAPATLGDSDSEPPRRTHQPTTTATAQPTEVPTDPVRAPGGPVTRPRGITTPTLLLSCAQTACFRPAVITLDVEDLFTKAGADLSKWNVLNQPERAPVESRGSMVGWRARVWSPRPTR
jgi:hypothetical protein